MNFVFLAGTTRLCYATSEVITTTLFCCKYCELRSLKLIVYERLIYVIYPVTLFMRVWGHQKNSSPNIRCRRYVCVRFSL